MASISAFLRNLKRHPAFVAFLFSTTFIVLLCFSFVPCWERNDDVAMSMIAHGYGLAAYGSPNLVFSNVLWGYIVRAIPTINGVLGYSLATMAVLLMIGWAMLYFLLRLGTGYLLGMLVVALLIARPTLIPQFTVNAGFLTVVAIIGWLVHAKHGDMGSLVAACLFAFFGYLVRNQEFFLVLGVALPLLPWRALRGRRPMQIAFLLLVLAIASAAVFDRWSYSGSEWQQFMNLNSARIPYTDYDAGWHLKQHSEILTRHGYSQNDIDLVSGWLFVDPQIADPKSLNAMLSELGPLPMQQGNVQSGFEAIKVLWGPVLLPLLLCAILLLVLMPRRPVMLAWMICITALFAMGVIGRPGALRAYIPLLSLLLLSSIVFGRQSGTVRQWIRVLTLFIACIGNSYLLIPAALATKQWTQQVQRDIHHLPNNTFVSWGEDFPFELAYPVLSSNPDSRDIQIYGLNSFTLAPFSVANAEQTAGRGMLERLISTKGIAIVASANRLEMLRIYCSEHLNGNLRGTLTYQTRSLTVQQVRCDTDK